MASHRASPQRHLSCMSYQSCVVGQQGQQHQHQRQHHERMSDSIHSMNDSIGLSRCSDVWMNINIGVYMSKISNNNDIERNTGTCDNSLSTLTLAVPVSTATGHCATHQGKPSLLLFVPWSSAWLVSPVGVECETH